MRIFYICFEDLGIQAAWTTHIREVTENLKKLGHNVILFAPNIGRSLFQSDVRLVSVPILDIKLIREYTYYLFLTAYLLYYHLKNRADILYVREMAISLTPFFLSRFLRLPYIVEVNGMVSADLISTKAPQWKIWLYNAYQRFNTKTADRIIVPCNGLKQKLIQSFRISNNKIIVVENGTNTKIFYPMNQQACRAKLNLPTKYDYLVFVGRFYPHHGISEFLEIIPSLLKRMPHIKIILIGEGYLRQELEKRAICSGLKNSIIFTGEIAHNLVPFYINAANLCLIFIIGENKQLLSPIKLFEYWACSRPVITNKGNSVAKLVKELNAGISIDLINPEESAEAIVKLLKDGEIIKEMGDNGRGFVINNNTWEITARKIEKDMQRRDI